VRFVPRLCVLYLGIWLTTEGKKKHGRNLSQGSRKVPVGHDSMRQHGRILLLVRTSCHPDLPALGSPRQRSVSEISAELHN